MLLQLNQLFEVAFLAISLEKPVVRDLGSSAPQSEPLREVNRAAPHAQAAAPRLGHSVVTLWGATSYLVTRFHERNANCETV